MSRLPSWSLWCTWSGRLRVALYLRAASSACSTTSTRLKMVRTCKQPRWQGIDREVGCSGMLMVDLGEGSRQGNEGDGGVGRGNGQEVVPNGYPCSALICPVPPLLSFLKVSACQHSSAPAGALISDGQLGISLGVGHTDPQ